MTAIVKIEGPTEAHRHEYLRFRAVTTPDVDANQRARIVWTVLTNGVAKSYWGASIRHLVAPAEPAKQLSVSAALKKGGPAVSRNIPIRSLQEPPVLHDMVSIDPPVETLPPMSVRQDFGASVGFGPVIKIGSLTQQTGAVRRVGIFCIEAPDDARYRVADHASFKHWSKVIEPTILEESGASFTAVNTYDRASFSYGIIQFAAHTYDADFHAYFREVLQRFPEVQRKFFPEFELRPVKSKQEIFGRNIVGVWSQLTRNGEPDNATFRSFIKPQPKWVTTSEFTFAAKLITATRLNTGLQKLQVEFAVARAKRVMTQLAKYAPVDGLLDELCAWVFDITTQGRATYSQIAGALAKPDPVAALRQFGLEQHAARIKSLERRIVKRRTDGIFGTMTYDKTSGEFK